MQSFILFYLLFFFSISNFSQSPVSWKVCFQKNENIISFDAKIDKNWHLYAVDVPSPNQGPLPTKFHFTSSVNFSLVGKIQEEKPHIKYDENFGVKIAYFENKTTFKQKIEIHKDRLQISGFIEYMTCNDKTCYPYKFEFKTMINPPN